MKIHSKPQSARIKTTPSLRFAPDHIDWWVTELAHGTSIPEAARLLGVAQRTVIMICGGFPIPIDALAKVELAFAKKEERRKEYRLPV